MQRSQRKFPWQTLLVILFFVASGVLCSWLNREKLLYFAQTENVWDRIWHFAILLGCMYLAMVVQTVIHELGHLFFGFLTGYRFCSFRVGPLMLVKSRGRLRLKKFSLAGTGGQCLMIPPDLKDGKLPVVLYNLGGSILNFMVAGLCLMCCTFLPWVKFLWEFLLMAAVIGFAYALTNGVPLRMGILNNDGYNAIRLGKNPEAMRAWWIQLKASQQVAEGVRVKDMPADWFAMPDEEGLRNSITATLAVFACNRLMDEHRFSEADALMEKLLDADAALVGLHRRLLINDRIYCGLTSGKDKTQLQALRTKQQRRFENSMQHHLSVLRTQYTWALLLDNDSKTADKFRKRFRNCARSYPYLCEMEAEQALMKLARDRLLAEKE